MNKREKSLLTMILVMVVLFAHILGIKWYMTAYRQKEQTVNELGIRAASYRSSTETAAMIADEVKWLSEHEPEPSTVESSESELLKFLESSSSEVGLSATGQKLIPIEDSGEVYRRVKIEVSANGTEEQIYKWLVAIHQPTEFRAVTQILMKPVSNDESLVSCTLTAEKWLIEKEVEL
ncbi:hypothetical protein ACFPK9_05280 [Rubritalea spongiae]|uniref:General secretion pathway protein GspM n=1 Tax=Rubritalea spongiae TaxID=430797 RepID=A0ABW5E5A5_9BACT